MMDGEPAVAMCGRRYIVEAGIYVGEGEPLGFFIFLTFDQSLSACDSLLVVAIPF